ncbi:ABC transporter ATP-binding protein [Nitrosovibrio sp. Nv17]|uniref:ABC transporter ATP-binding protein n=1 Tax=Nitrosovibrio sp. Nv17 TaxID=1855339 RepID=UPI000908A42F|nr:ABC transporter ATP-binding protein [Nitrosovibrio sp. Nv17]SFW26860.1 ABC-2 type transport system ATP-binding protein/lipopolysaccharide transport system ATP-binding protein [Nitrosovibrio sp. Nv17]
MSSILLENVSVDLPVFEVGGRSLKKRLASLGRRNRIAEGDDGVVVVHALDNLSLSLVEGDRVGLVGHNGAGKSTLLRVLAGIYPPTSGVIHTNGRVVPLLDISLGMDELSTGRQNIRLRGLLLGMKDAEIRRKTEEIAVFTELGDHLDLPLRTYSSGMRLRLAFAVSTAVDPDILLLDEVIGVGDASFMEKAEARMRALHSRAQIVVLASHSHEVIQKMCNKVLWMERGRIRAFGEADAITAQYVAGNTSGATPQVQAQPQSPAVHPVRT